MKIGLIDHPAGFGAPDFLPLLGGLCGLEKQKELVVEVCMCL